MLMPCESGEFPMVANNSQEGGNKCAGPWLLLIDDDRLVARSLGRWVERVARMDVRVAQDADEAERLVRASRPTALISDFELRGAENGVDVLLRLRRLGCQAPAALLTAAPDRALTALTASPLNEVIPVFSKAEYGALLTGWLDQLRLCWAQSA